MIIKLRDGEFKALLNEFGDLDLAFGIGWMGIDTEREGTDYDRLSRMVDYLLKLRGKTFEEGAGI